MEEDLIVMDGETRRGGDAMWAQVGASVRCITWLAKFQGCASSFPHLLDPLHLPGLFCNMPIASKQHG
jgi:hypothetical protein